MKFKSLSVLALAGAAVFAAAADQVENFRDGSNASAGVTGGHYAYAAGPLNGNDDIDPSPRTKLTKAAGSLDATVVLQGMFPSIGSSENLLFSGVKVDGSHITWTITAPTVIGDTVPVNFGGFAATLTVATLSGTLNAELSQLPVPETDVPSGNYKRSVKIVQVGDGSTSSLTVTGTLHTGFGDFPGSATFDKIQIAGLGGPLPRTLASCTVTPSTITGGNNASGTVTLSSTAPTGGLTVALASTSGAIGVPASVEIAGGAASGTFAVTTTPVSATATRQVKGTLFGVTRAALVTLVPALNLKTFTVSINPVLGGNDTQGTLTLTTGAPAGGSNVAVSTNSSAIIVPSNVLIAQGATTQSFTIGTRNVSSTVTRQVSATYLGVTKIVNLTINPNAVLMNLTINPAQIKGGTSTAGTVTLDRPAPAGGAIVQLSSNSSAVVVPASVTVNAGATSVGFNITTSAVGTTVQRIVTATRSGVTKKAIITLTP